MAFGRKAEPAPCEGCKLRQETIDDLREQLRELNKAYLAVSDKAAYRMLYGRPPGPATSDAPSPPPDPRYIPYTPAPGMSFDEIEKTFTLDQEVEAQQIAEESRKLDDAMAEYIRRNGA